MGLLLSYSLSFAEEGCDDAGIAATMEYGNDDKRFFLRCVSDQKVPHGVKK